MQPVPFGVAGELYVGGVGVGRGYLNNPTQTQAAFIPNPFGTGRLYKTGDKARYLPDNNIEFLGRLDYQVKIRGFRIELGEIEAVLAQSPLVEAAAVTVREDNGNRYLVGYVVPATPTYPSPLTPSKLRQILKDKLPDYMVPSAFVVLDTMPLTPNGKVDRNALPVPDLQLDLQDNFVAPQNPTQEVLAGIWAEILNLPQIGIHDNFFEQIGRAHV